MIPEPSPRESATHGEAQGPGGAVAPRMDRAGIRIGAGALANRGRRRVAGVMFNGSSVADYDHSISKLNATKHAGFEMG